MSEQIESSNLDEVQLETLQKMAKNKDKRVRWQRNYLLRSLLDRKLIRLDDYNRYCYLTEDGERVVSETIRG